MIIVAHIERTLRALSSAFVLQGMGWLGLFAFSLPCSASFAESIVCRIGVLLAFIPTRLVDYNYRCVPEYALLAHNTTEPSLSHLYPATQTCTSHTIHNLIASSIRIVPN